MTPRHSRQQVEQDDGVVRTTFEWRGITIALAFEPDGTGSALQIDHLELQSIKPMDEPLPVTETGFRSLYLEAGPIERAGGPLAYAVAWLDHAAQSREWKELAQKRRQLDLFD